jgi:hypothetical protein
MRRIERIHLRHDQGDAQEEGHSRGLWHYTCTCVNIEKKNTHEHTIPLAIRLTNQIRYARFECELDASFPHKRRRCKA